MLEITTREIKKKRLWKSWGLFCGKTSANSSYQSYPTYVQISVSLIKIRLAKLVPAGWPWVSTRSATASFLSFLRGRSPSPESDSSVLSSLCDRRSTANPYCTRCHWNGSSPTGTAPFSCDLKASLVHHLDAVPIVGTHLRTRCSTCCGTRRAAWRCRAGCPPRRCC
jgi:hypothetical protein